MSAFAEHQASVDIGKPVDDVWAGRSRPSNLVTRLIDRAAAWQLKREIDGNVVNLKRILETSDV